MLDSRFSIPPHIVFLFRVYGWGLVFFILLRTILLLTNVSADALPVKDYLNIVVSYWYGFRFDTSVSCYLLALPLLITSLGYTFRPLRKPSFTISYYLVLFFYSLAFFISCADIPFFGHFGSRITTAALLWADSPKFMAGMIFGTFVYSAYLLLFVALCYRFFKVIKKAHTRAQEELTVTTRFFSANGILFLLLLAPFVALGIRGRIAEKSPMLTGTAYFCDNNLLNQLGLNPVFTFMTSALEDLRPDGKRLKLMNDEAAIKQAQEHLGSGQLSISPIARQVAPPGPEREMNVVLVIMEGMSSFNMGKYGGRDTITPVLDSLMKHSLSFENIFTQGIHTYNGIYSTLFSYPALLHKHCMEDIPGKKFYSMPQVLKERGYETKFFITHDGQFDNAQGFLTANGFDSVFAEADYPSEKVLSTLGAPDDYIFDFSIPRMNEAVKRGKKFFAGFMTGSNHHPIIIPPWVKKDFSSTEDHVRIVQYSDWAIGELIKKCSAQPWYSNTIFVFIADHGANMLHTYDMPLAFHHTPLIVFAPGLNLAPRSFDCMGGQMDVFPTVMGLMNLTYVNNTMGIDLLKEKRPFIYFTADTKIGCIDRHHYFIHRMDNTESLHYHPELAQDNLIGTHKAKADSMRNYAFSMLQATQWIIEHEKFAKR